jgi:hypothetical protein
MHLGRHGEDLKGQISNPPCKRKEKGEQRLRGT